MDEKRASPTRSKYRDEAYCFISGFRLPDLLTKLIQGKFKRWDVISWHLKLSQPRDTISNQPDTLEKLSLRLVIGKGKNRRRPIERHPQFTTEGKKGGEHTRRGMQGGTIQ